MTKNDQDVGTEKESGGSIGFLRASEKMQISTFEIPLVFLEDMGFSKQKIQAAKDLNRKFVSGFYGKVRKIGEKLSFGGDSSKKLAEEKSETKKTKSMKAAKVGKEAAPIKAKSAKVAVTATTKTPEEKESPSNVIN